jgi:ATPase complex subunit ATP10
MNMIVSRKPFRLVNIKIGSAACLLCQWRTFSTSFRRLAEKPASTTPPPGPLDEAPRSYGKAVSEFTPKPLSRPIGLPNPPRPGENTGIDKRTLKQRRDDFVDYDKHLKRRKEL